MPMGRGYRRRALGRSVLKRGLNHMRVPRAFPTTSLTGSFIGQQTLDLTGTVKSATSLFQLFAFRNSPDLTDSSVWATNSAGGAGIAIPAQLYRNISMWANFYQHVQIEGCHFSLNFTKFTSEPPTFRAYIWSSCDVDTGVFGALASDDLVEPVGTQPGVTDVAFDAFKILNQTDITVALLEQSRRVVKVDSVASRAVGRVDLDLSFYLPYTTSRRGLRIPKAFYRTDTDQFGNHDTMTKTIANVTAGRYGFRNQINVAVISTSADASTGLGDQFLQNLTIKTKILVKFLDRDEISPA